MPDDDTAELNRRSWIIEGQEAAREFAGLGLSASTTTAPEEIGRYRIEGWIGEGAMGVVYEAVQAITEKRVALKVIRNREDSFSPNPVRFKKEAEMLGRLQHRGIAQIHEANEAETGELYLAMELVDGLPLTDYCLLEDLPLRKKLELFADVCDAVHYAHQRLVIHRDLKPAHIAVDDEAQPHLLDFGLGRCLAPETDTGDPYFGAMLGTPAYMSPEQTQYDPDNVDVRTDIYSLGVILYEVLTGSHPYDVNGSLSEILHNVREAAPTRPSAIGIKIDNDLETILLKTLEKDRERRYDSVMAFGADIRHYLKREPIRAKPNKFGYVFKMWALRNSRWLAAASVIVALQAVPLAWWLKERGRLRKEVAVTQDYIIDRAYNRLDFFPRPGITQLQDPREADPGGQSAKNPPGNEFGSPPAMTIDGAIEVLTGGLDRYPDFFDALKLRSRCYYTLGRLEKARDDAKAALELRPGDAIVSGILGRTLIELGDMTNAIRALIQATQVSDNTRIWYDLGRAYARKGDAAKALAAYGNASTPEEPHAQALDGMGRVFYNRREYDKAAAKFEEATLASPDYWPPFYYLALCHQIAKREAEALDAYEELIELQPEHLEGLNNAAWIQLASADPKLRNARQALVRAKAAVRLEPRRPACLETLALAELRNEQTEAAYTHAEEARTLYERKESSRPEDCAWSLAIRAYAEVELSAVRQANKSRLLIPAPVNDDALASFLVELDEYLARAQAGNDNLETQETEKDQ